MEAIRAEKEWQRAGVHYVRTVVACEELGVPIRYEFADDTPDSRYVLVMEGEQPVATCRVHILDQAVGKIERVDTIEQYRHKGYAKAAVLEAENWMREEGIKRVVINSREEAVGFYERIGYTVDESMPKEVMGPFVCVKVIKEL